MWGLKATPFPQLSLSSHLASSHSALGNPFSVCVGGVLWAGRGWMCFTMAASFSSQGARGNDGQSGPAGPPVSSRHPQQVYLRPIQSLHGVCSVAQCNHSRVLTYTRKEEE